MDDRILIIIFDGVGDRPVEELGGKTPLEYAETPNLDKIAKNGINGLMDTIKPGVIPGSDTGHLALLGYDPFEVYTGRGPFEAAGLDIDVKPNDIAFRCNFATIEDGKITNRRAGRIKDGTEELAKSINDMDLYVDFTFKASVEHRAVLVFRGANLGADITDVDPHETGVPVPDAEPLEDSKENKRTSWLVNEFVKRSIDILKDHPVNKERIEKGEPPANVILPRGTGVGPNIKSIPDRTGLKGAAIAGIPLVAGVCKLAGMDILEVDGATGGLDTDIENIFSSTREALDDYDFILVNIKGPDLLGHDGLAEKKVDFIEKIDRHLGKIMDIDDLYCAYTGDHSTPVTCKGHSGDPLPITICGPEVRKDKVGSYGERQCSYGSLGRIRGKELLDILRDLAKKADKFGA